MKRPSDITQILPIVEALATYGVVRPDGKIDEWLQGIGVVGADSQNSLRIPREHWLRHAVPSADPKELLRKTALFDPLYRQHLDLGIASILHMIAKTERWERFEELLFGQFKAFSPRFAQLLAWMALRFDRDARLITENDWIFVVNKEAEDNETFNNWNEFLWGASGPPSALFPLLGDLYIPLLKVPVHLSFDSIKFDETQKNVLHRLICSAQQAEGIAVDEKEKTSLFAMIQKGLPVRIWPSGQQMQKAGLVGNVVAAMTVGEIMPSMETTHLPVTMPNVYAQTVTTDPTCHVQAMNLWSLIEGNSMTSVYYSLDLGSNKWPDEYPKEVIKSFAVPPLAVLRESGKSRSASPQVDTALQWLGDHPLYGFLLQLFLLEALDRELGEETLVLIPGTERDENDWCDEGSTRVVYKPRTQGGGVVTETRFSAYDLGALENVIEQLSRVFCIDRIAHPYALRQCGAWATAFYLLRQAEIISDRYNRWSLAEHILDRLYGGGLMTSVIRRGKEVRESLHVGLKDLWDQKERMQKKREEHNE